MGFVISEYVETKYTERTGMSESIHLFNIILFCHYDVVYVHAFEHKWIIYRGSYMSAHVLLNLLNDLGKKIRCEALPSILSVFPIELINSMMQEHECKILFIIWL